MGTDTHTQTQFYGEQNTHTKTLVYGDRLTLSETRVYGERHTHSETLFMGTLSVTFTFTLRLFSRPLIQSDLKVKKTKNGSDVVLYGFDVVCVVLMWF